MISLGFVALAMTLISINVPDWITDFKEEVPYLFIENKETSRAILTVLIGGILSLTVFSFTMVMVVLNQASTNFSPRLLPRLISNRNHQVILGIYIGTLLYCILVLIALGAYGSHLASLGFSSFLAACFGVICVGIFVYFIHNISEAIQIHNIIRDIYSRGKRLLAEELRKQEEHQEYVVDDINEAIIYHAPSSGYFRHFDTDAFRSLNPDGPLTLELMCYPGQHIWEGEPVFRSDQPLNQQDKDCLFDHLTITEERHNDTSGLGAMTKLMEVAVKSLSPGINDPGTAIETLARLASLIKLSLNMKPKDVYFIPDTVHKIIYNHLPATELFRIVIQPIRHYAREDSAVLYELISLLNFNLIDPHMSQVNKKVIEQELQSLGVQVQDSNLGLADKEILLKRFVLNNTPNG